jgi:hypothetical protein
MEFFYFNFAKELQRLEDERRMRNAVGILNNLVEVEKGIQEDVKMLKQIKANSTHEAFYTNTAIKKDQLVIEILKFIVDGEVDEVKEAALDLISSLAFANQEYRVHFIQANAMKQLVNVVNKTTSGNIGFFALSALQILLSRGHPGDEVATQMKTVLPGIFKRINPNYDPVVLWKLKLITIHCLGLLAFRVTLNQECLNLINDFLALNHFKIRIDCYTIKPHDVINILKSTDKNIRLSGYFILHHCTLVKGDSNWPDVVTLIWNNIDDFNTPYYGHLLEKAATKLETFRENFVADIKRQLNAKKSAC